MKTKAVPVVPPVLCSGIATGTGTLLLPVPSMPITLDCEKLISCCACAEPSSSTIITSAAAITIHKLP